jgi:single-strand DNA-binding protein
VDIIADTVQFLGSREGGTGGEGNGFTPSTGTPVDQSDFQAAGVASSSSASEDDIPF